MHCYCLKNLIKQGSKVLDIKFDEFNIVNETTKESKKDENFYCDEWFFNYGFQ